jgi:hypothetical protein
MSIILILKCLLSWEGPLRWLVSNFTGASLLLVLWLDARPLAVVSLEIAKQKLYQPQAAGLERACPLS